MKLNDVKLVVVTGAGSGIGRAVSLRFARLGATIVASDIDLAAAEETVRQIQADGGVAHARELDVVDTEAFAAFAESVRAEHGVCDVIVNNAGIASIGQIVDTTEADWDRVIGINLLGVITGARVFGAQMAEAGKRGHIVNIASAAAFAPLENLASYSTTKAAVKMFSDCLRSELRRHKIGVTAICPGAINTNIGRNAPHIAVSEEDAAKRAGAVGAVWSRMSALHIFPGPDSVARAVQSAVEYNRGLVVMRPEGYLVYALNRIAPSFEQRLLSVVSSSAAFNVGFKAAELPLVRRVLKTG